MTAAQARDESGRRAVRLWLWGLCVLVFAMIVVGGATRLTESGLSITEWQPILGAVPPLTEADWQAALEKYRQIPQYKLINRGMSLEAFKAIYWWEWTHRFLGRAIGVAFLLPFAYFWTTGRLAPGLPPRLLAIFALGGAQGALGWYMVMSGLADRVDVSQYRLAAHLGLAFVIFAALLWLALRLGRTGPAPGGPRRLRYSAAGLLGLILLQVLVGALVAGLDAGQGYNSWPLIDGRLIPGGLGAASPWYLNLFENALTVQFAHRTLAYAIVLWAAAHWLAAAQAGGDRGRAAGAAVLTAAVLGQAALGVWTLLAQAPLGLGLLHQAGAAIVFATALWHLHALTGGGLTPSPAPAPDRR